MHKGVHHSVKNWLSTEFNYLGLMVFKPVDPIITEIQKPLLSYFSFKMGTGELKNHLMV